MKNVAPNTTPNVATFDNVKIEAMCCGNACAGMQLNDGFKCYQCDYWRASEGKYVNYCRYYEREGFAPDHPACKSFT